MKKNELIQSLKIVIFCLVVGIGANFVSVWAQSSAISNTNNVRGPLLVNSDPEVKSAGLGVDAFFVNTNSQFGADFIVTPLSDAGVSSNNRELCVDNAGTLKVCSQ